MGLPNLDLKRSDARMRAQILRIADLILLNILKHVYDFISRGVGELKMAWIRRPSIDRTSRRAWETDITSIPTAGNRHFLDAATFLFIGAYPRGLFTKSLGELLDGDDLFLAICPDISQQPVLIAIDQRGNLTSMAMKDTALNPKLQDMCVLASLTGHNDMYGLRREALTDAKWTMGLEDARFLAGHRSGSKAIEAYFGISENLRFGDATSPQIR
ncbi:hypothetical protein EK21DRAFT_88333 [Setomelanomma holmii]|uniref:Uncharacterized protein n=1 Tax=Setomelanomma holmii TaxID=210430 RepID=A0A9P4LL75_9PLEO|nr:hypothetical protein EK21DRAFT_88333 [Setomelanomma holmii]